jgi:hypothetical protein
MVVAPTIDKCINPCAAAVVEEEKPPYLPIYRHTWESKTEIERAVSAVERPREKVRGCNGSSLAAIAAAASAARDLGVEFEWSDPPPPCML